MSKQEPKNGDSEKDRLRKDRRMVLGEFELNQEEWAAKPADVHLFQWMALCMVERNKLKIEADGMAVLEAVALCLNMKIVLPPWLQKAFCDRLASFQMHETATLDEAFDVSPMTRRTRDSLKSRRELIPKVSEYLVNAIERDPNRGVGGDLFAEAAEALGIGKSLCEELYYEGLSDHQNLVNLKDFRKIFGKHPDQT